MAISGVSGDSGARVNAPEPEKKEVAREEKAAQAEKEQQAKDSARAAEKGKGENMDVTA